MLTSSGPEGTALVRNKHLLVDSGKLTWSDLDLKRKKNVPEEKEMLRLEEGVGPG